MLMACCRRLEVECTFLECVEGMDIRRNISAISLTQVYCRYFYTALKFGARPCKRNTWIALTSFLSEHIDMVMF